MRRAAALLFGLALAAYLPAILHGGFIWDDDVQILNNPHLGTWAGLGRIWSLVGPARGGTAQYYPLTFSVIWLEHRLWGFAPLGYHLVNVLLHGAAALLFWRLLVRLAVPGALLAAAVFAVHPVHAESVAWVIELKNTLSGALYFAALLFLWRAREDEAGGRRDYAVALAFFAAALAAKTAVVVLPVVFLIAVWWRDGAARARDFRLAAPFFALALGAGLVTVWVETRQVGAEGGDWSLSLFERALVAGRAVWFYLGKLAWPSPLSLIYPRWEIRAADWTQSLYPAALGALLCVFWRLRDRLGRAPAAVAAVYLASLAPVLGFVNVYFMRYSFVADHFQYLASAAPIAAFGALVSRAPRPALAALVLALGAVTFRRAAVYESVERVWADTLEKNPGSWLANNNLGVLLAGRGRLGEAFALYERALRAPLGDHAETLNNMGLALAAAGRPAEAVDRYRQALALKPGLADARHNLGAALAVLGRRAEAAAEFREALRLNPGLAQARSNLGAVLAVEGRLDEAMLEYREALRLNPALAEAHGNLALALARRGRLDEAILHFRETLRLEPGHQAARAGLALAERQKASR